MGILNGDGYTTKTFAEYKTELQAIFQAAFGIAINLDEESPQGVMINALAEKLENLDKIGLDLFNQINLNFAVGLNLDNAASIRGFIRKDGTKATVNVDFTSSATGYTIPANSRFSLLTNPDILFENASAITITSLTQNEALIAVNDGLTGSSPTEKLDSVTYFADMDDVEITSIADGTDTETDDDFRFRIKQSSGQNALSSVDSILTHILSLEDVQKAIVYENDTNVVDARGIPAHSIECIALGDTDFNVATAIFEKKPAGTPTFGAIPIVVNDLFGNPHTINIGRPIQKTVYIKADITAKEYSAGVNTANFETIRTECLNYIKGLKIGEDVSYTTIYGFFAKYNDFDISLLELSFDTITWVETNLTIGLREYPDMIDKDTDIEINVV